MSAIYCAGLANYRDRPHFPTLVALEEDLECSICETINMLNNPANAGHTETILLSERDHSFTLAKALIDFAIASILVGKGPHGQQRINVLKKLTNARARVKQHGRV